jgi:hypothetical protein
MSNAVVVPHLPYDNQAGVWKNNPNGAFLNRDPRVSCQAFNGQ